MSVSGAPLDAVPMWRRLFERPRTAVPVMMALGLLPGLIVLNAPLMIAYDDKFATTENPLITHGLGYFFTQLLLPFGKTTGEGFSSAHWSPLSFLSLAIDHAVFGKAGHEVADFTPWGFRLMSGLYHGLCGWLALQIGLRLTKNLGVALFAALVFLFHPTVTESVCWVVERNNILPALFGLWALYVFTGVGDDSEPSWARTLAATALLVLSQLCKGSGISWWPVLVVWDCFVHRQGTWTERLARAALLAVPVALTLFVLSRSHADVAMPPLGEPPLGPWLMGVYLAARYILLLLWPVNLSFFYYVSPDHPEWPVLCGGLLAALALAAWARWAGVPWRRILLYAVWIAAGFGPYINPFVTTSFPFQDRYLYVSLPGFGLLLGEAAFGTWQRMKLRHLPAAAAVLLALLLGLAVRRAWDYRDLTTLLRDAIAKQPASSFGTATLANYLFHASRDISDPMAKQQSLQEALQLHRAAKACDDFDRQLAPLNVLVEHGSLAEQFGLWDEARAIFGEIRSGREEHVNEQGAKFEALRYLCFDECAIRKHPERGLELADQALALRPDHPVVLANRLRALVDLGRLDEARAEAQRLRGNPAFRKLAKATLEALEATP